MMIGDRRLEPDDTSAQDERYERWVEAEGMGVPSLHTLYKAIHGSLETPYSHRDGSPLSVAPEVRDAIVNMVRRLSPETVAWWRHALGCCNGPDE